MFDILDSNFTGPFPKYLSEYARNQMSCLKKKYKSSNEKNQKRDAHLIETWNYNKANHSISGHNNSIREFFDLKQNTSHSFNRETIFYYDIANVRADKQLINQQLKYTHISFVNTICDNIADINIALDTNTDVITLNGFVKVSKGMIGKMKEKKIFINLCIFDKYFIKNIHRLNDLNSNKLICLSTFSLKHSECRNKEQLEIILNSMNIKNPTRILENWENVIKRRIYREKGTGTINRSFIQDYILRRISSRPGKL